MPDQYSLPYGDAVVFQTPHLDRALNNLYTEQRYREQQQMRENAAVDQMVNKEIGKVRSVDTSEIIGNYQQYKALKQQLYNNQKLRRNPQAYNEVKRRADLALQNTYQQINKSQELLNGAKMDDQSYAKNPNSFDDNYGTKRAAFWQTPMSELQNHEFGDLSNPDTYRYQGSNTDWQKILNQSIGTAKPVFSFEEKVGDKGLQTKITPYSFGNTPAQVKESLLGAMGQHRAGRDAEYLWDQLPQQEIETTIAQYKAIPQDKLTRMGLSGPQDLAPRNPQSKAENYASYLAMKYAINNEPKAGTPQLKNNMEAVEDYRLKNRLLMEQVRQGNREALASIRHAYKQADKKQQTALETDYWNMLEQDAQKPENTKYVFENGKTYQQQEMKASPQSDAILFTTKDKDGDYQQGDAVRLNPDDTVEGIIYKRDDKGNIEKDDKGHNIIKTTSRKLLKSDYRIRLIKSVFGAKEAKAEEGKIQNEAAPAAPAATPQPAQPKKPSLKKGLFD